MAARSEREPPDAVQLNQLMCERVRKELRCQKLHTEYGVNPLQRGEAARPAPRSHRPGAKPRGRDTDDTERRGAGRARELPARRHQNANSGQRG